RQIRKWKRREAAAITDEEREFARRKVREWQAIQRKHLALSGREFQRDYAREEPGRLRDGPDHLAPRRARRRPAEGRQGDRGLRQPHLPQPRLRAQPDPAGTQPAPAARMSDAPPRMTSHRPYLLRALYEWIADNGMTPHLLVDATRPG